MARLPPATRDSVRRRRVGADSSRRVSSGTTLAGRTVRGGGGGHSLVADIRWSSPAAPPSSTLANAVVTAADVPKVGSVAGRFRLDELAVLVADASLVISGDTGVAHLATAYGTPSVLLFGPTPPALWGPPAGGPHLVLWHGGRGDPHGSRPDPSLLAIDEDEVLRAAESMLDDETIGQRGSPQGSRRLATS